MGENKLQQENRGVARNVSVELPLSSCQFSMCVNVSRSSDPSIVCGTTHSSIISDNAVFTLLSKRCGRDEISVERNGTADEAEQTGDVDREELRLLVLDNCRRHGKVGDHSLDMREDQGRGRAHLNEQLGADENEQIVIPSLEQIVFSAKGPSSWADSDGADA